VPEFLRSVACALCLTSKCRRRFFETFSFLPPLSDGEIARQIDYIIANGWTPCLEFADADNAYIADKAQMRFGNSASCVRRPPATLRSVVIVIVTYTCVCSCRRADAVIASAALVTHVQRQGSGFLATVNLAQSAHVPCSERCNGLQGYYDNRYWAMWKLPMFGCTDPNQVLNEVAACKRAFNNTYVRLVAFDNIAQCQTISFLVHRPANAKEFAAPEQRSIS
jgi:ribulose bisphosphate carboxylase small subunit